MKFKPFLIVFAIIIAAVLGIFSYQFINKDRGFVENKNSIKSNSDTSKDNITLSLQSAVDKVIVDNVKLSKNGFLVVRQMEGDKLGQIVEMSSQNITGEC